jgi:hypothetical protein
MRKSTKKFKTTMKMTISNTTKKERGGGGVDSLKTTLKERSTIKGG